MSQCVGILLLLYALTLAESVLERHWTELKEFLEKSKCRRLRKKAAATNRQLYKQTGDEYFRQRAEELEKGV